MSSKYVLLNKLLSLNCYDIFKEIIKVNKIQIDMFFTSELLSTFSLLLEWMVYPISFQGKSTNTLRKDRSHEDIIFNFPRGFFSQYEVTCEEFFEAMCEVLNSSGCLIFARRSTFLRICNLLREIMQN